MAQRSIYLIGLFLLCFVFSSMQQASALQTNKKRADSENPILGIAKSKPKSGRFVPYKNVFLVPYKFLIPGTKVSIEMVPVPAGKYLLKYKNRAGKDKSVLVNVKPFWIAKTETTWDQYQSYMALDSAFRDFYRLKIRQVDEKNKADAVAAPSLIYDKDFRMHTCGGLKKHPAANLSQYAAKSYTKYLSRITGQTFRLPSAVEWKYAARASFDPYDTKPVPGAELKKIAWFESNSEERNLVGTREPNAWGIHDMLGNVAEWVLDGEVYDERKLQGMTVNSIDAVAWPTKRHGRLALGGSFFDASDDCQVESQKVSDEDLWDFDPMLPISPHWTASDDGQGIGFRIMRPVDSSISKELAKRYWESDHKELTDDIRQSIESRGSIMFGVINPSLPDAIKKLKPVKKERKSAKSPIRDY